MYTLLEITCNKSKVTQLDMFGTVPTLNWLYVAEQVKRRVPWLQFAVSLNNKLFLFIEGHTEETPLYFALNGAVSAKFLGKPSIKSVPFSSALECIDYLLAEGEIAHIMFTQLAPQSEQHVVSSYNSFTGASLDFLSQLRRPRWNGDGYIEALSPLSEYLLADLEVDENELLTCNPAIGLLL